MRTEATRSEGAHRRRGLIELAVENYRSLRNVTIPLGPLNVLVGPNGAGKTNVLEVLRFLADVVHTDLEPALLARGGFDEMVFHGGDRPLEFISIGLKATWTPRGTVKDPDVYLLRMGHQLISGFSREEYFRFPKTQTEGEIRIGIDHSQVRIDASPSSAPDAEGHVIGIQPLSSGLSTLRRLSVAGGEVRVVADHLASMRFFEVSVDAARQPSRVVEKDSALEPNAANLAAFLRWLRDRHPDAWDGLVQDAIAVLPQLQNIDFEYPSGAAREVVVVLQERGLRRPTQLADASYGTIRLLGLLALLYDPSPPALTCVEEIDHGLHPQALELLVARLREASDRTQFLIATHSPALADRLRPDELIVCERREDGSSAIPALTTSEIEGIVAESEGLPLGDLWFSGALGGDL